MNNFFDLYIYTCQTDPHPEWHPLPVEKELVDAPQPAHALHLVDAPQPAHALRPVDAQEPHLVDAQEPHLVVAPHLVDYLRWRIPLKYILKEINN